MDQHLMGPVTSRLTFHHRQTPLDQTADNPRTHSEAPDEPNCPPALDNATGVWRLQL